MADGATRRRVRVLLNPNAGSKAGVTTNRSTGEQVRAVLGHVGLADEIVETTSEQDAASRTREAVEAGYDAVVAAGGDGTVAIVANEVVGTHVALGILPLGSVMNMARMLGIPRELDLAAEIIARGESRVVDVGLANNQPFYEAASVGMNAAIFREGNRVGEGNLPSLARGIRIAFRYRPARMLIQLDDEAVRTRALMITVANGPYSGMGLPLTPDARVDDALFDVRVFRHFSKLELLRHTLSLATGRRPYSPHVSDYRSRRVRVESRRPLPVRADSRDLGTTPVEFLVRPAALRVLAPPAEPRTGAERTD